MSPTRKFPALAAELTTRGSRALARLPTTEELEQRSAERRQQILDGLRVELFALASLLADGAVRRARRERPTFPPYGLAKTMHSQSRLLVANPEPVDEGSIDSFMTLGRAFLDTLVFHLDRQFKDQYLSDQRWQLERLETLLTLFRVGAAPATQARLKDGFAFMYGGLQFGVSVCAQLAEVMAHMLEAHPDLTARQKAETLERSLAAAYRMAGLNVTEIVPAYQGLISPERGGWMDPARFVVRTADEVPVRIELKDDALDVPAERRMPAGVATRGATAATVSFTTQGCPARTSPAGESSAIATLWRWVIELAHDLGLLGPVTEPLHPSAAADGLPEEEQAGDEQDQS